MVLGPFRYCGPFLFTLSIPVLYDALGPLWPLLTIAALLLLLISAEGISARDKAPDPLGVPASFRLLPFTYIPLQLAVIAWAVLRVGDATPGGFLALSLAVGVTTGVFGVLAAHELVHAHDPTAQIFAVAMLSGMGYRHFRIAHVRGHHRWAATERDPATARLGEGFYDFVVRAVAGQFLDAWRIEQRRLAKRHLPFWKNAVLGDVTAMAFLALAILYLAGWRGVALFSAQCAVGILVLELFNYIAHYGLVRRTGDGRREPFGAAHSWNSSNVLANALIFNMGRHAHHHARPFAPYQTLQQDSQAPELPWGYAGSILLALVPPLWHRVMDQAVQSLHTRASNAPA